MPDTPFKDLFISHSSQDNTFLDPIVEELKTYFDVFYDRSEIVGGQDWLTRLDEGLHGSRVSVLFITENYLKSKWGQVETRAAFRLFVEDNARYVLPVLLQGVTRRQYPFDFLNLIQVVDCARENVAEPAGRSSVVARVVEAVRAHAPGVGSKEPLDMPFVILAMTYEEAQELLWGAVVPPPAEARHYAELTRWLSGNGYTREELLKFYGATRNDWRPPFCRSPSGDPVSLRDTIEEIVGRVNRLKVNGRTLIPRYYSAAFTAQVVGARVKTTRELKEKGCVLLIDSLSLFHPTLRRYLDNSAILDADTKTAPVVVPLPYCREPEPIDKLIEEAMSSMLEFPFYRFDSELDMLCEFGVGHPRALRRWLFSVLPKVALDIGGQSANPDAREALDRQVRGGAA